MTPIHDDTALKHHVTYLQYMSECPVTVFSQSLCTEQTADPLYKTAKGHICLIESRLSLLTARGSYVNNSATFQTGSLTPTINPLLFIHYCVNLAHFHTFDVVQNCLNPRTLKSH